MGVLFSQPNKPTMEALLGEWLNNIAGPQYASAVMWTVGALVVLVIVLLLIRAVRGVSFWCAGTTSNT
jgi:hypothetical protein